MSTALYRGTVTLTVELALSAATGSYGAWGSAVWDTSTWGPSEIWSDVSDRMRSLQITRKFSRSINAWDPGTASLVLNNRDGALSPSNPSSPFVTGGITGVRPWRPMRVRATYAGVTYDVFRGYVLAFKEGWSKAPAGKGDAWVTVPCIDEFGSLARVDGFAGAAVGAGEVSGRRMHRVLDAAGHTGGRVIDLGDVTMQATTLAANAVTELKLTSDSEGGAIYVNKAGDIAFERRYALIENARSNSVQTTFDDSGGGVKYNEITSDYDGELLVNIAAMARVGGTSQVAADATSRALYQDKRDTRTDLICETDAQALQLAQFRLIQSAQPEQRISSVTLYPRRTPAVLFPIALGREVRDLVRVTRTPPGGYTITRDCHVSGITHNVTPANWSTTFDLWSALPTQNVGRWDIGVWDQSTWFI